MSTKSKKRKVTEKNRALIIWERANIFPAEVKYVVNTMWEIPQIFQFLLLTKESLGLGNLSIYEMERMFLIPRASKQMAQVMTSLLSSNIAKMKSRKIPLMPYEFWNNILAFKTKNWFKLYDEKHGNAVKILENAGIEPQFWNVFSEPPFENGKEFEDLTLLQRVWLLKTICDTYLHCRKSVQEELAKQPTENLSETVLGTDRHGIKYIYFPQFLERNDLRVYKHSLDNDILSTVKPRKKTQMSEGDKTYKRKSRWKNGLWMTKKTIRKNYERSRRNRLKKATNFLVSKSKNSGSASSCGNNNNSNSNNNNMDLNASNGKDSRSPSRCSNISIERNKVHCDDTKLDNCDGNPSLDTISDQQPSEKMLHEFSNTNDDKCDKQETNRPLGDLNSNSNERRDIDDSDTPLLQRLQKQQQESKEVDNLTNIPKTDDEKLNDILNAELRNKDSTLFQSKSDDEKLSETRTDHKVEKNYDSDEESKENDFKQNGQSTNAEIESNDDNYLNELGNNLHKEENDFSIHEDSETENNDRKLKNTKMAKKMQKAEDFYNLLLDLSMSKFQLVADSVASLRRLISHFSKESCTDNNERVPSCEVKLVQKLNELLSSVENLEPILVESSQKAKEKLQKEWLDFKNGSVENHDSSGKSLSSNWWVVGSQGCPLQGDAIPRTLSQSTLPSTCTQAKGVQGLSTDQKQSVATTPEKCDVHESESKAAETRKSKSEGSGGGDADREEEEDGDNAHRSTELNEDTNEEEQQSRRVLRARGISSYTEQLYSDDDIEGKVLDEWTDVEAIYAAPNAEASDPVSYHALKTKHSDDRTNEEDSDQDWILPSRRRKAKRPSAYRRLKAFQQKLQSIRVDKIQEAAVSVVLSTSANEETEKQKPVIKDIQICNVKKPVVPLATSVNTEENQEAPLENESEKTTVPSTETSCKVENIESVHSELDIKDEGPIYDSTSEHFDNSYATNINPSYVMLKHDQSPMSYYVMQPDSAVIPQNTIMHPSAVVPNITPPLQQGYYVQGEQNYIIQTPQPSFISPHPFQQQGPQIVAPEQFVNHPGYVPYMMTPAQTGFVATDSQIIVQGVPQNSTVPPCNPTLFPRFPQNRYPAPRQSYPHPNGAAIRSNVPLRGHPPRNNAKPARNVSQQRTTPVRPQKPKNQTTPPENSSQKITSLIVLSDSDDEIEMIITEKTNPESEADKTRNTGRRSNNAPAAQKSPSNVARPRNAISPQILERMNQGGISITPVKPPQQPVQNASTQLVVVVNETGSHYALALPNGSKLILTNEQVAQIRASNGGKLIL